MDYLKFLLNAYFYILPEAIFVITLFIFFILFCLKKCIKDIDKLFYNFSIFSQLLAIFCLYYFNNMEKDYLMAFEYTYYTVVSKIIISLSGIGSIVIYGRNEKKVDSYRSNFFALFLIAKIVLYLLVSVNDVLVFLCLVGILNIVLGIMVVGLKKSRDVAKNNFLFFVSSIISFSFLFFGIALLYYLSKVSSYESLSLWVKGSNYFGNVSLFVLILIIPSILGIVGSAPFGFWISKINFSANSAVSSFLKTSVMFGCIFSLGKLLNEGFILSVGQWKGLLLMLGTINIFLGTFGCIMQNQITKMLGYGYLFHLGFMLLALSSANDLSLTIMFIYSIVYLVSYLSFAIYFKNIYKNGSLVTDINELKGAANYSSGFAMTLVISISAFAGIPPFIGFIGKIVVINSLLESSNFIALIIISVTGVLQIVWASRIISIIYYNDEKYEKNYNKFSIKSNLANKYLRIFCNFISVFFLFFAYYLFVFMKDVSLNV